MLYLKPNNRPKFFKNPYEYALAKAAISGAEGKKDKQGKTISGSVKEAQIKNLDWNGIF